MSQCDSLPEKRVDECDALMRNRSTRIMIENRNQQFLVANPNRCLTFKSGNDRSGNVLDGSSFSFEMYCNNQGDTLKGLPVTIHALINKQKHVLCCAEKENVRYVYAKQLAAPLPNLIEDPHHEAVFFLQSIGHPFVHPRTREKIVTYKLESGKWPKWYFSPCSPSKETGLELKEFTDDDDDYEKIEVFLIRLSS